MVPFLSIIIPVYNIKEEYLRACFDSIISQDMGEFKVIVVDDGSTNNCGNICDEYAKLDKRFSVIHQENKGVSIARNSGIALIDTDWVTFIDSDDWVETDFVSTLFRAKEQFKSDIFLFDYCQEFANTKKVKHLMKSSSKLSGEWIESFRLAPFNMLQANGRFVEYEHNPIWNKMYNSKLIQSKSVLFDPNVRNGEDSIFNAEIFQYTDKFTYIHKALYHYRCLQSSVTNRFNPKMQYYNEIAFQRYECILEKFNLPNIYWESYYARVVTRLYSCMRLYYFHLDNELTWKETTAALDKTLNKEPYKTALKKVSVKNLTKSQRIFVFLLKNKKYRILKWLVKLREIIKNLKGEVLS